MSSDQPGPPAPPPVSYRQLMLRRLLTNPTGVFGLIGCSFLLVVTLFAGFFAPYGVANRDAASVLTPPQIIRIVSADGTLTRPHVLGFAEEMNPTTFEITFVPSPDKRVDLVLLPRGDPWRFGFFTFDRHLFGGAEGRKVHLLGTDGLGRDVLSRMLLGGATSLGIGFVVVVLSCLIGTVLGIVSGYFSGRTDMVIQRLIEFVLSFPDLPLYLALTALIPRRTDALAVLMLFIAVLVILRWASLARELRGKVLAIRSVEYVKAARAVGCTDRRILGRHVAPNVSSHVIVWATYQLPEAILVEGFLSFLGVGVQAPMVSWGVMLNQIADFQTLGAAPWLLSPVVMIIVCVLAFNALGDGLRDAMDPYRYD